MKLWTSGVCIVAAMTYGLVIPSKEAGAPNDVALINVGGASAEALFALTSEAINAHKKHRAPKKGHLRRAEPN